jgi:hypothetical protein
LPAHQHLFVEERARFLYMSAVPAWVAYNARGIVPYLSMLL